MKDKDRPVIGINLDLKGAPRGYSPTSQISAAYYDCVLTAGGLPILIPPLTKEEDLHPVLDRIDGLVLVGGDDLDPRRLNLPFHQSVKTMPERRENADRALCKAAMARRLPTLGIGVGMQEMNVCYGGTNYLHLPEDFPKGLPHKDPHGGAHCHAVEMVKGTRMYAIYGPGEVRVTSHHHQGVKKIAPGFVQGAAAPDGLIEAIEAKDKEWFAVGVQWHPENDGHISMDTQLFEAFTHAAAATRASTRARLALAKAS